MPSSGSDDAIILKSESERALSITYRTVLITILLHHSAILFSLKICFGCVVTSSRSDDVINLTSDYERALSIIYRIVLITILVPY